MMFKKNKQIASHIKPFFIAFPACQLGNDYDKFFKLRLHGGEFMQILRANGQIGVFIFTSKEDRDHQLSFRPASQWRDAEILYTIDGITETVYKSK
jgi:hypothetical protein